MNHATAHAHVLESTAGPPVLILGAGINGAALARELVLNGVGVWVVDVNDIASGATSRSTRLVHGGLRYLEYGDFRLVGESLAERARLLELAPQYVQPLRLYIPVQRRRGGMWRAAFRFLGGTRSRLLHWLCSPLPGAGQRGLWVACLGLWLYDRLAGSHQHEHFCVHRTSDAGVPQVDTSRYRWLCSYTDAQMLYPERFTLALLEDARQLSEEQQTPFRVWTHHRIALRGSIAEIRRASSGDLVRECSPRVIVNATGAWGDLTLGECRIPSARLFGGTKGSHFITFHAGLRRALGDAGIYAEAADGRLVFVLPFGEAVLVGTTDEHFEDRPERAVATEAELAYLLGMVREVFPAVGLTRADIVLHYSGVRPLPHVSGGTPGAISRDFKLVEQDHGGIAVLTIVGGKLTTCRAVAEETSDHIFERLGARRTADSRRRPVPGAEDFPPDRAALAAEWEQLARRFGLEEPQVQAMWKLCGTRCRRILEQLAGELTERVCDTDFPLAFVRWIIRHEWVATLADLVERRLLLLYEPRLSRRCLMQLACCLAQANRLHPAEVETAVNDLIDRLARMYGRHLVSDPAEIKEQTVACG